MGLAPRVSGGCLTPQTVAHQAPLSMEFSRQEYWSVLPFISPGDLPDPGIKLGSPALAGEFFTTEPQGKQLLGWVGSKSLEAAMSPAKLCFP